jgi:hypothetical protein
VADTHGELVISHDLLETTGKWQIWLIGEHRYGRLKERRAATW